MNTELSVEVESKAQSLVALLDNLLDLLAEKLFDTPELQDELFARLREAKKVLQKLEQSSDPSVAITGVEFEIKSVRAKISQELKAQEEESLLRRIVPLLIVFYIICIISLILFRGENWSIDTKVPIIGIPVSVMAWAGIGSIAAILYKFYKYELGRMRQEIRWLIARPVIGVIMGSLAYLAITSGVLILGGPGIDDVKTEALRPQVIWIVSFLGGFSDRFFETVISVVMGRFVRQQNTDDQSGPHSGNTQQESK